MGICIGALNHPKPDPEATRAKLAAAGPNEYVEVTRDEFEMLKRQVQKLEGDLGSDQMARALTDQAAHMSKC